MARCNLSYVFVFLMVSGALATTSCARHVNCNNYQSNPYYFDNRLATPQTAYTSRWDYFRPWVISYTTLWVYPIFALCVLVMILCTN